MVNAKVTVPTGTSTAIASATAIKTVVLKALSTNTASIFVGFTGTTVANGFELAAGDVISIDTSDLSLIFSISGTASQDLRYLAY
jgi:hypothetical protein